MILPFLDHGTMELGGAGGAGGWDYWFIDLLIYIGDIWCGGTCCECEHNCPIVVWFTGQ